MVTNELVAFQRLGPMQATLDPRSFTIATFALCGFANFSSIGIQIGGIGALAPNKKARAGASRHPRHARRNDGQPDVRLARWDHAAMSAGSLAKSAGGADEFARAARAAKFILSKTKLRPQIALVLGSGLGAFADELAGATRIPYQKIPGFPQLHRRRACRRLVIGKVGRSSRRRDAGPRPFVRRIFARRKWFSRCAFLGGSEFAPRSSPTPPARINLDYSQGALVVIRDHINLQGTNPLIGPNDDRFGPRFPDMTQAYCKAYREIALREAKRLGIRRSRRSLCRAFRAELRNARRNSLSSKRSAPIWSACPPFPK